MNAGGTEDTNGGEPFDEPGEVLAPPGGQVAPGLPAPDPHLVAVSSAPPDEHAHDHRTHTTESAPTLPNAEARAPVPMVSHTPVVGASTWYRTDQQRYKSVYRRANPWYRRLGRAVVGLTVIVVLAGLLYFGAQQVQDYLNRDKLPKPGQEAAQFASTSFLVTSSSPAPELNGTITVDTASHAFEFVGSGDPDTPQSGLQIVSPDGTRVYVRQDNGTWHEAADGDDNVAAIMRSMPYLLGVNDADDILENKLRKNYVDLIDEATEGVAPDALEHYEMAFDTAAYSSDYPLQWQDFEDRVIPGAVPGDAVPVSMWIDEDHVVMRLRDDETHWAWERLAYSNEPFTPIDPGGVAIPAPGSALEPAPEPAPTTAPAG
jgi:hypothetical protein